MTAILVSALMMENGRLLLVRREGAAWDLPGGPLAGDESIEEALERILQTELGVQGTDAEFLDTYYERAEAGAEPLVRNVYLIRSWTQLGSETALAGNPRAVWLGRDEALALALPEGARQALREACADAGPQGDAPLPGAPILVVTGPPAAGKSTVARELCARFERAAHVEVDLLRHMVVSGYASPAPGLTNPLLAVEQLELAAANAAALARNFSLMGYRAVIDDVLTAPEQLDRLLESLRGVAEIYLVTLLPSLETLAARDTARDAAVRQARRCAELHQVFSTNGEERGLRVDSSGMDVDETVACIVTNLDDARIC